MQRICQHYYLDEILRLVEDFVVMVICSRCLKEMEKVREVKGDDKKEDS